MAQIDVKGLLDPDIAAEFADDLSSTQRRMMLMQVQTLRNQRTLLAHFEAASLAIDMGPPIPKRKNQ